MKLRLVNLANVSRLIITITWPLFDIWCVFFVFFFYFFLYHEGEWDSTESIWPLYPQCAFSLLLLLFLSASFWPRALSMTLRRSIFRAERRWYSAKKKKKKNCEGLKGQSVNGGFQNTHAHIYIGDAKKSLRNKIEISSSLWPGQDGRGQTEAISLYTRSSISIYLYR